METPGIIYLLRTCATINDELAYPRFLGQRTLAGLSPRGRAHAEKLAEKFAGRRIVRIYSSPLPRSIEMASLLNPGKKLRVEFVAGLKEADMGDWDGHEPREMLRHDPVRFEQFLRDPGTYGFPGGESLSEVCRRGLHVLNRLAKKHPHQRIIVIGHKYLNRALLTHFCGVPMYRAREIDQSSGCMNLLRIMRGNLELRAVNYLDNFGMAEDEEDKQCASTSPITV